MKIKTDTIVRTIVLFLSLLNQVASLFGFSFPSLSNETYQLISTAITAIAAVWCWWKNNSITQNALIADDYFHLIKGDRPSLMSKLIDEAPIGVYFDTEELEESSVSSHDSSDL